MGRIQAIAKFTYQWGMVVGVVAVIYRLVSISPVGESIARSTTIEPRNALQLSVLLLLMSIASAMYAGGAAKTG
ncbi:MAG TPA: hypothetical protein VNK82_14025 [Terriglobales bacterium]|nr:hypothetical protein [Terriglobales bacterium]